MQDTVIRQKVLCLYERGDGTPWVPGILGRSGGLDLDDVSAARESGDSLDDLCGLETVLVFASRLGDEISASIEYLRAVNGEARIVLLTKEGSLDSARRALGLGVDEYVTSCCCEDDLRLLFRRVFGEDRI